MTDHCSARVTPDPRSMMGKPSIKGTRVAVEPIPRRLYGTANSSSEGYSRLTIKDIRATQAS